MNKYLFLIALIIPFFIPLGGIAQKQKKPIIMILPSDAWCNNNNYVMEIELDGKKESIPDYKAAISNDIDFLAVIAMLNDYLAQNNFPAKAFDQVVKTLDLEAAYTSVSTGANGESVYESPYDLISKRAKSDINLEVTYRINSNGPKKSVTFLFRALDPYTGKEIATMAGTGEPSFGGETAMLLEETVRKDMDNFLAKFDKHFQEMEEMGREISIKFQSWDSWENGFYTEIGNDQIGEIIENWFADHSIEGRFTTVDFTDTYMMIEQIRIPLFNEAGRGIDARRWARELQKFLQAAPYNIPSRLDVRGLGKVVFTVGTK